MNARDIERFRSTCAKYFFVKTGDLLDKGTPLYEVILEAVFESDARTVIGVVIDNGLPKLGIMFLNTVSREDLKLCYPDDLGTLCKFILDSDTEDDKKHLAIYLKRMSCPKIALEFLRGIHSLSLPSNVYENLIRTVAERGDEVTRNHALSWDEMKQIKIPKELLARFRRKVVAV